MKNDGGPAFPARIDQWNGKTGEQSEEWVHRFEGMTLRDWFAGQALAGMVAGSKGIEITPDEFAESSYQLADAMIAERNK